jgi:hypothetical protein
LNDIQYAKADLSARLVTVLAVRIFVADRRDGWLGWKNKSRRRRWISASATLVTSSPHSDHWNSITGKFAVPGSMVMVCVADLVTNLGKE